MSRIQISDFKGKMINMHTHTARCMHARGEDREYVEKAIEAGFEVLGMSDHALGRAGWICGFGFVFEKGI